MRFVLILFCLIRASFFLLAENATVSDSSTYLIFNQTDKDLQFALLIGTREKGYKVEGWQLVKAQDQNILKLPKKLDVYFYAKTTPYQFNGMTQETMGKRNWRDNTKTKQALIHDYVDFEYYEGITNADFRQVTFKAIYKGYNMIYQKDLQSRGFEILMNYLQTKVDSVQAAHYNPNLSYQLTEFVSEYDAGGEATYEANATLFLYCKSELIKTIPIHRSKKGAGLYEYSYNGFFTPSELSESELVKSILRKYASKCPKD